RRCWARPNPSSRPTVPAAPRASRTPSARPRSASGTTCAAPCRPRSTPLRIQQGQQTRTDRRNPCIPRKDGPTVPTRKPEELQQVLHYQFRNPALLRIALTHTSYANESKVPTTHNERLEFLGDSVLSVVASDYLFHQSDRPEGELTRMRASLVSEEALFQFAGEIRLGDYLRLGRGEELGGGRNRPSVVSDAFEAVIAALYLDGGLE